MTKNEFQRLTEKVVILDGATGTNLIEAGMPRGVCTEKWILENPKVLLELQRSYVEAGSQIIYAPTFGANRRALALREAASDIKTLNKELVELSLCAADGKAYVAGNLTTSGRVPGVSNAYTYEDALEMYTEQITYLAEAGADLLAVETMISIDETVACVEAATMVCDLPIMCSMTIDADGSLFSGGNAVDAVVTLQQMGASAVGINCSVGPDQLEAVVAGMKAVATVPILVKPNAGIPVITTKGEAVYSMNAEDFAKHMEKLVSAGAGIIGGCCGTTPAYIQALCKKIIR